MQKLNDVQLDQVSGGDLSDFFAAIREAAEQAAREQAERAAEFLKNLFD